MNPFADTTAPVRKGEEVDLPNLRTFLKRSVSGFTGPITVEQFPGGHSNLTYFVKSRGQELVLRRPPFGSTVKSAHDMGREFKVLSKLHSVFGPAPEPVAMCEDESVLGVPFYLMRRIPGIVYRARKPEGFEITPHRVRNACYSFIENLAELHSLDYKRVGLEHLYKGAGYVERQVTGWERRWEGSKTEEIPAMERIAPWLKENLKPDIDASIIHNDYKFDNLVFDADNQVTLVGVLDWEMSTIGDPLADFAVSLSYWRQASDGPATHTSACFLGMETGALTREELITIYGRRTGRDLSELQFYFVLALYKAAVIGQQIYYRYKMGLTQDARFERFFHAVRDQAERAVYVIETGEI